jgi:rare lipoprotein A
MEVKHIPMLSRTTVTALFLILTGAGCADDARDTGDEAAAGPATLSAERIAALAALYPVLDTERAPAPRPSANARPGEVPERVGEALPDRVLERVTGEATFYADRFEGRRTASGVPFRQNQMVAAHRAYPFGTLLRVTNLRNDRSVNVRVVDRGPFGAAAKARGAVLDLSRRAAERLGYIDAGRTRVSVEVLEWGNGLASRGV